MQENLVIFKGTKDGIAVILDNKADFNELRSSFEEKSISLKNFFKSSKISLNFKGRSLRDEEIKDLVNILATKAEVEVVLIKNDEKIQTEQINVSERNSGDTKFHKGTLRSGQSINFEGNVVVIGDVNPGAEVVAGGNVIILGILRGTVHAGAINGNDCFVAALNLNPMQLRIGNVISRAPEGIAGKNVIPEIAHVKDNLIIVERIMLEK